MSIPIPIPRFADYDSRDEWEDALERLEDADEGDAQAADDAWSEGE